MPEIIDNSTGIITVSEYSKSDILRFFPHFPAENIFVTPLAANENYKPLDKENAYLMLIRDLTLMDHLLCI